MFEQRAVAKRGAMPDKPPGWARMENEPGRGMRFSGEWRKDMGKRS
jgi:hypothetical protein